MKKITLILILLLTAGVCISAANLSLKKIRDRGYRPVSLTKEFRQKIAEDTKGLDERDIVLYCYKKTQDLLTFYPVCEKFDDRRKTRMHCVGYAQVLATICNYAFSVNGIKGKANPVVGHVYLNGINLNQYSGLLPEMLKNFTKDHDFVEVRLSDGNIMYADASLNIVQ